MPQLQPGSITFALTFRACKKVAQSKRLLIIPESLLAFHIISYKYTPEILLFKLCKVVALQWKLWDSSSTYSSTTVSGNTYQQFRVILVWTYIRTYRKYSSLNSFRFWDRQLINPIPSCGLARPLLPLKSKSVYAYLNLWFLKKAEI